MKKPADDVSSWGLPKSFAPFIDAADEWPYPDPDEEGVFGAVIPFADYPASEPDMTVEPFSEAEPWGRMATETPRQYQLFDYYRSLGITRQKTQVAEHFGVSRPHVHAWAAERNWDSRCREWDDYLERIYTAELVLGVKEMAETHAQMARAGIEALGVVFTAIKEQIDDPDELAYLIDEIKHLPAKTQMQIAKGSAQVMPNLMGAERLARGLPTELNATIGVHDHRVTLQTTDDLATILLGLARPVAIAQSPIIETEAIEPDD